MAGDGLEYVTSGIALASYDLCLILLLPPLPRKLHPPTHPPTLQVKVNSTASVDVEMPPAAPGQAAHRRLPLLTVELQVLEVGGRAVEGEVGGRAAEGQGCGG